MNNELENFENSFTRMKLKIFKCSLATGKLLCNAQASDAHRLQSGATCTRKYNSAPLCYIGENMQANLIWHKNETSDSVLQRDNYMEQWLNRLLHSSESRLKKTIFVGAFCSLICRRVSFNK